MRCSDFERLWNERLDARGQATAESEPALDAHSVECPVCRDVAHRYERLRRAIAATRPLPTVPLDFAGRVLASRRPRRLPAWRRLRPDFAPRLLAAASAAAVWLLFVGLTGRFATDPPTPKPAPTVAEIKPSEVRAIDPDSLGEALTVARTATWELARETSAPAARIGRGMIESATLADRARLPLSMSEPLAGGSEVIQSVGHRLQAGVQPLSGSARQAFGFLLGPSS